MEGNIQRKAFLTIWVRPRETIRKLVNRGESGPIILLAAISGVASALTRASNNATGDDTSVGMILILALFIGTITGIIGLYLSSWLIRLTGRWIGGKGDYEAIRMAVGWTNVTSIVALVVWLVIFLILGREIFQSEMPSLVNNPILLIPFFLIIAIEIVIGIWTAVILIKTVAEVQGFSAWKGLGNILLAGLLLTIPILIIFAITMLVF